MSIKKTNLLLLSIVYLLSSKNLVAQTDAEQTGAFFKGAASSIVAGYACQGFLQSFKGDKGPKPASDNTSPAPTPSSVVIDPQPLNPNWWANFAKSLSYAYAVSKIAPYSRESLLELNSKAVLFDGPTSTSRNRGVATLRALFNGAITGVTGYYGANELWEGAYEVTKLNSADFPKLTGNFGRGLALLYTLYKSGPDSIKHLRIALGV